MVMVVVDGGYDDFVRFVAARDQPLTGWTREPRVPEKADPSPDARYIKVDQHFRLTPS